MKAGSLTIGLLLAGFFCLCALFAPALAPSAPGLFNLPEQLASPSAAHWFGRNHQGEDLLTLVLYGGRISLSVGLTAVLVSSFVGSVLGLTSGYFGGAWDQAVSRLVEIVLAFPGILLAIAIAAVLGPSLLNVVAALCVAGWVPFARLVRAETILLREREFVMSARVLGLPAGRILFRHILPNLWAPLTVQATFSLSAAILAESSLSFLGLGVPYGTPSWGKEIADGTRYLLTAPHLALFPGLAIMLSVLAFNLLGDGLRDRFHGN